MKNKPFIILGSVNAILILSFIGLLISFKMEKEQEVLQVKQQKQLTENQMNQIVCLAENIYFEARNQGTAGWLGVTNVVINRKNDGRFPNTVCEVVYQAYMTESSKTKGKDLPQGKREYIPILNKWQFSWYCDNKPDDIKHQDLFQDIYEFSELALTSDYPINDITDGATHYHAHYVKPAWRKSKTRTVSIGDHIFYRWETK